MNRKLIFISCLLFCFFLGCQSVIKKEDIFFQAQQIKAAMPEEHDERVVPALSPLRDKETFVYKAKFFGVSIGTFLIMNNGKTILNGHEAYCFELSVKTLPFFSILFKTKDRYVSYMDTQKFVVLRHEEYIDGGARLESAVDFDYERRTATYKNFLDQKEVTVKIPATLLDILSGNFYLRMMPLGLGDTVDLNIYADQKVYNLTGLLSSMIKVDLPTYGKQDAYRFKPYLFLEGQQITKISAEVFFSKTSPSKTLLATLKTLLGNVNVVLVEEQ